MYPKGQRGISFTEFVVVVAIIAVGVVGIIGAYSAFLNSINQNSQDLQANFLLEETIEVVKFIRDGSWTNISSLTAGTSYYLATSSVSGWESGTTPTLINGFDRTFSVASVNRDSNDDIATSGTDDPLTKLITVEVAWLNGGATTTKTVSTYITNL